MPRKQTPLSLEYILLGFLNENPAHGYDLYKKIRNFEGISLIWNIKQSQLYALLDKLENSGLLVSSIVPGEIHLMRKEYRITPVGRQAFIKWVNTPVTHGRDMRQEFLAKLYFAHISGSETSKQLITEQSRQCAEWLSSLEQNFSKASGKQVYRKMIFQYRISQVKAMLEWLDYCLHEMTNS